MKSNFEMPIHCFFFCFANRYPELKNWKINWILLNAYMLYTKVDLWFLPNVEINTRSMEKILWNSLIELWKSFGPKKKKFVEFEFKNEKTFFSICLITGTGWVRLVLCIYTISQEFIFYSMCSKWQAKVIFNQKKKERFNET